MPTIITTIINTDDIDVKAELLNRSWANLPHGIDGIVTVDDSTVAARAQEMWDESNHKGRWQ